MNYKRYIAENFEEIFPNQFRIYKENDVEIIFYKEDDQFIFWNNLEFMDVTNFFKEIFKF